MFDSFMEEIGSDEVLEEAYAWLCKRREYYSHNDDVWQVRYHWDEIKPQLQSQLLQGDYSFSPLRRVHLQGQCLEIWTALDSLVLKSMAIVLAKHLAPKLSRRCTHLAGNGGAKAAVREVLSHLPKNKFVFRTDVKSYYASIRHDIVHAQLAEHIDDPRLLALLWQYMRRSVYDGGLYEEIEQGISLGCPLSPLMGALFLDVLDKRMDKLGMFCVRFMDDWIVLAPSRWKLRRAVRIVNQTLAEVKGEQQPDKTFVGRIARGFSFLGYQMNAAGLVGVAPPTMKRFVERVNQLYEQGADASRIGEYVRRWLVWVRSAVPSFSNTTYFAFAQYLLPISATPPTPACLMAREFAPTP